MLRLVATGMCGMLDSLAQRNEWSTMKSLGMVRHVASPRDWEKPKQPTNSKLR